MGFGDIVALTDAARLLVTLQILLDLAVIAGIARTIVSAARVGVRRREARGETDASEDSSYSGGRLRRRRAGIGGS